MESAISIMSFLSDYVDFTKYLQWNASKCRFYYTQIQSYLIYSTYKQKRLSPSISDAFIFPKTFVNIYIYFFSIYRSAFIFHFSLLSDV